MKNIKKNKIRRKRRILICMTCGTQAWRGLTMCPNCGGHNLVIGETIYKVSI